VSVAEELTLWVEETEYGVWVGMTDDSETVQTYSAVPLAELRRVCDALAAIAARLEREEEL
jgi:hypothetical protein